MNRRLSTILVVMAVALAVTVRCGSPQLAGATSETTNGVSARVLLPGGAPAAGCAVHLRPAEYRAGTTEKAGADGVTDDNGSFQLSFRETGALVIEVLDTSRNWGLLVRDTLAPGDSLIELGTRTLEPTGTIEGRIVTGNPKTTLVLTGIERTIAPASDGRFSIPFVAPGEYSLVIKGSADTMRIDSIAVSSHQTIRIEAIDEDAKIWSLIRPGTFQEDSLLTRAFLDSMQIDTANYARILRTDSAGGRIRELHLENLGIRRLHPSISSLGFVWSIYLDSNPLATVPPELRILKTIGGISLNATSIDSIPSWIGELFALQWLTINGTKCRDLPMELANNPKFALLSMNSCSLTIVPPVVFSCTSLTLLNVAGNEIATLPAGIGNLKKLQLLAINDNRLTRLPNELCACAALTSVFAYKNQIDSLPACIGSLTGLTVINVGNNALTSIPESIGLCSQLVELAIDGNRLTALPATVAGLTSVRHLYLAGNSLCALDLVVESWVASILGAVWRSQHPQMGCS